MSGYQERYTLPVNDTQAVQVVHGRDNLADEFLHLALLQALVSGDVLHEVAAGTALRHQVVAVLRLQHLQQLHDVGVPHLLQQPTLAPQILAHIRVSLGSLLVDHLHGNLHESTDASL